MSTGELPRIVGTWEWASAEPLPPQVWKAGSGNELPKSSKNLVVINSCRRKGPLQEPVVFSRGIQHHLPKPQEEWVENINTFIYLSKARRPEAHMGSTMAVSQGREHCQSEGQTELPTWDLSQRCELILEIIYFMFLSILLNGKCHKSRKYPANSVLG